MHIWEQSQIIISIKAIINKGDNDTDTLFQSYSKETLNTDFT